MAQAAARTITKEDNKPALLTRDMLVNDFDHVIKAVGDLKAEFDGMPRVLEDDEDLEVVTKTVGKISAYVKRCDDIRLDEGKPHRDAQDVLMKFFRDELSAPLTQAMKTLNDRASVYLRKKRAAEEERRLAAAALAQRQADEARQKVQEAVSTGNVEQAKTAAANSNAMDAFAAKATVDAKASTTDLTRTRTAAGTASLQASWTFEIEDLNTIDLEALRPFIPQTAIEQALRAFIKSGRRSIKGARIYETDSTNFRARG